MCLILLAFQTHPRYPIVFAANRDEFYERPTARAHFWPDAPHVLAGRDEQAGGTWCGVNLGRSLAAVTNYREPPTDQAGLRSRGALVSEYLRGDIHPEKYLHRLAETFEDYGGFNLLVGDADQIWYLSNRRGEIEALQPGLHALSNHLLNTPWFKTEQGKADLRHVLEADSVAPEALFDILANEDQAEDELLPDTGFGRAWERVLSPRFIRTPDYGTRSSTVILIDREGNLEFRERTYERGRLVEPERVFLLRGRAPTAHEG